MSGVTKIAGSPPAEGQSATPVCIPLPLEGSASSGLIRPPITHTMRSGFVLLLPGQDVGPHNTGDHEEMIIAIAGEGRLELEGRSPTMFPAGWVAYVPPQTQHNVINTGAVPLKYLYVVAGTGGVARRD